MTYSEVKLWNELKNGKLNGYDFDRQRAIGNYIVDFYWKDVQLAIEIDGITHEEEKAKWKDEKRQKELEEAGVYFLRFDALLVVNKVEAVVREISNWLEEYEKENGVSEFVKRRRERKTWGNPPLTPPRRGCSRTEACFSRCFAKSKFFNCRSWESPCSCKSSPPWRAGPARREANLKND